METHTYIKCLAFIFGIFFLQSCQDLEQPPLGEYLTDGPIVSFNYPSPTGATVIQSTDEVTSITISYEVSDDIEITSITVDVNGNEISNVSSFTDVENVMVDDLVFDNVTTGVHSITITATDSDGNETTESVMFEKIDTSPYEPELSSEFFYMPFDGNYNDMVSNNSGIAMGDLVFSDNPYSGENAFTAPTDAYLQFPISQVSEGLGDEFSGAFWYNSSGDPNRAGIITIGNPDAGESRNQGLRLFREGDASNQTIKLNIGTGGGESWNNGGQVTVGEWTHVAFTVSPSETKIFLNGTQVNTGTPSASIDWTGCENISIGSGAPTFTYWGHNSDTNSSLDELRFFNTALTNSEVLGLVAQGSQVFNMSFNGNYIEDVSTEEASQVGTPGFAGEAFEGSDAFQSATDSYLTFPLSTIGLDTEFSAIFRYKVVATPDRASLLIVGDNADDRFQGFRFFREGSADSQTIKLNVGTGAGESWNNGGAITVADGEWVQVAFTVSESETKVYFDGVLQNSGTMSSPIDWTGCTELVIGGSGPTFGYWGHASDQSPMDELKIFDKALTQEEIQALL